MLINTADQRVITGIDIGSVALSSVTIDLSGNVITSSYGFHHGRIPEALEKMFKGTDLSNLAGIATVSKNLFDRSRVSYFDHQTAVVEAGKSLFDGLRSIMLVGAERFQLINFDSEGRYQHTATNTSCAVGTGSFLDQQARRMNLEDVMELCRLAQQHSGELPGIASRCSVFAKTDLIHAQQEGYSRSAICDSLCKGLAKNIADTLFSDDKPASPMLFAGGVSKNQAVAGHLESFLGITLLQHPLAHVLPAYGACLLLLKDEERLPQMALRESSITGLLQSSSKDKEYFHKPLVLALTRYPDFTSAASYEYQSQHTGHPDKVQVDLYRKIRRRTTIGGYLGIDIGSTSTKALITNRKNDPVAGFYTYTCGRPLEATRAIFEAISNIQCTRTISFRFAGVGTTGSGRKFVGKIINADMVIDEITTHARAAYELNPETDTIIEIGGQDAKFTLMKEGRVTFAQMNTVCSAGTGSFIEEQARKLGVTLRDYSHLASGVPAPLASDRCTVFMERDINNYLNKGFSVNEILASVLYSVRENYLKKVAVEALIGKHICFQGATAKNKALVAAFEEKLDKEIYVSSYCHLAGAYGLTFLLAEEKRRRSSFRGLDMYKEQIPVSIEICKLCNNHCRIRLAEVGGEQVTYGFLCGRDYNTKKYIDRNISGFDLLRERKKHYLFPKRRRFKSPVVIGLPASLHLFEELSLWQRFFDNLSMKTLTSENSDDPVRTGKRLAGAEFCAPMEAMYGHVSYLAQKADKIFLPVYLEAREKEYEAERNYCYYTQYSPPVVSAIDNAALKDKLLIPFLNYSRGLAIVRKELWKSLEPLAVNIFTYAEMCMAFDEALHFCNRRKDGLKQIYLQYVTDNKDIKVVLLGRPYLVLSPQMNKGIPDIFGSMGIRAFYQDMIPYDHSDVSDIDYLLKVFPWYFAANILETAKVAAVTEGLYPVLVTAFKCAPDSFLTEYFRKIMDAHHKPYLILQIDEHDSNVGYETRIEAGIRSFRNHAAMDNLQVRPDLPLINAPERSVHARKTLVFPNWDQDVAPLLVANLRRAGLDVHLLEPDEIITRQSMAHNTGQCLPLNIITQEFIEYVRKYKLDPADTMLWMVHSRLTCNIRLFPYYIKNLLDSYDQGMEKAIVYAGDISHLDISLNTCLNAYLAYMTGGLLRKIACRIRPYELNRGETDAAFREGLKLLEKAFLGKSPMEETVVRAVSLFDPINYERQDRPRVAIFGDLYVRDNQVLNQDLVHFIEEAGGEVITTPYHEYARLTADNTLRRRQAMGNNLEAIGLKTMLAGITLLDKKYYKHFKKYLGREPEIRPARLERMLDHFNIKSLHSGES